MCRIRRRARTIIIIITLDTRGFRKATKEFRRELEHEDILGAGPDATVGGHVEPSVSFQ